MLPHSYPDFFWQSWVRSGGQTVLGESCYQFAPFDKAVPCVNFALAFSFSSSTSRAIASISRFPPLLPRYDCGVQSLLEIHRVNRPIAGTVWAWCLLAEGKCFTFWPWSSSHLLLVLFGLLLIASCRSQS